MAVCCHVQGLNYVLRGNNNIRLLRLTDWWLRIWSENNRSNWLNFKKSSNLGNENFFDEGVVRLNSLGILIGTEI